MFKFFRELSQIKNTNLINNNLKNNFRHTGDLILKITQAAASIAICFTIIEMRSKKDQLYKFQMSHANNQHSGDHEKSSENPKDDSNYGGNMAVRIIQVIASIATVAASIATCFTVVEMKSERNQLYKPQMIFESSHYSDDYKKTTWGVWDVRNLILLVDDEDNYPTLATTIYNIGSGAALEIEINFMLDNYEEYVEEISHYYSDDTISINDFGFTIHYDGIKHRNYAYREDCIIRKPFLLPGESMDIAIPKELCKLLYCLNCCTNGDYNWQPAVHLQISFVDLQGIRYCIDYALTIKMVISYSEQGNEYFHVDYSIEQEYLADEKYEEYKEHNSK